MKVASLVSGGKDSIYASLLAQDQGWDVTHYVTVRPAPEHPYLFHRPNVQWVELQARCAGVQHVVVDAGEGDEAERDALRDALKRLPVDGVTSGALASEYQRTRIDQVCHELGLKSFAPLWHHDPARHLRDLVQAGVDSLVVHVAADGLGKEWLGRRLDGEAADELVRLQGRKGINPAGEGGEYETFVVDAPQFSQRVQIEESEGFWRRDSGTLEIRGARLAFKTVHPLFSP
jgi:diphthine-ammonia ligase